jgi:C_GCAxxG_C_C family probable redox protein
MRTSERIEELNRQGFHCSDILLTLGLELRGEENPQLVKSVSALAGGMGFSGRTCGTLTGAACLLGLYAGRGTSEEEEDYRLHLLVTQLVEWFEQRFGEEYGGTTCDTIVEGRASNMAMRCPGIVTETFQKVKELLVEEGFELAGDL